MVAGAGADRISKGMRRAFGKPTHKAALIRQGQPVFSVYTYKQFIPVVQEAYRKASKKLSGTWKILIKDKDIGFAS